MRRKLYEILAKDGRARGSYDKFMVVCILCSIIPMCFKENNTLFVWIDRVTVAFFILDYIARWSTADFTYPSLGRMAFLRYPFGLFAIVDLLSILPYFIAVNSGLRLLRILRLGKSLKALRIIRYSKNFSLLLEVIKKEKGPLLAVCWLACGYVFISALIMFQAEPNSFNTFFDAIYWAMVTLTTVGYGDIFPTTSIGRIISMLSSFAGIAIVALPTGIITAGYMNAINQARED